ncbi:cysteine desulfurase family protein [Williamsia deligens]|uniref:Cysteine desulfurase family protein n=1 Tax=Williamsia deligens TaxID=321325 RepID=A0ABW3G0J4_9NOCA|nr:cysteine desulfurase family protein [Williamsia deligens]MCP2195033.1 cysteine desulfurase [Williamsia deligens]
MPAFVNGPVYLDHAASTPMHPAAVEAMTRILADAGNAASLHGSGRRARRHLEEARETVAAAINARPSEIVFTAGGTESDNLAIKGIFWARTAADPRRRRLVISAVEHHAVMDPAAWLADRGDADLVVLPVDGEGRVSPADLRTELAQHGAETALVSVMWANNEVGTIQPVAELAAVAAEYGVPFHTDAVQAVGHIPVDLAAVGVSALTLAAHKFGGPHGMGALVLRRDVDCVPLLHGGGHERDVRSGTPDAAAAAGMAAALRIAVDELPVTMRSVAARRDRLLDVARGVEGCVVNGPLGVDRLPGNAHVSLLGCEGDSLLMLLDANGIECSTGSACTAGVARASHVLLAMGLSTPDARSSLRFSLAPSTTDAEIDAVADVLADVADRARVAGMAGAVVGER